MESRRGSNPEVLGHIWSPTAPTWKCHRKYTRWAIALLFVTNGGVKKTL